MGFRVKSNLRNHQAIVQPREKSDLRNHQAIVQPLTGDWFSLLFWCRPSPLALDVDGSMMNS